MKKYLIVILALLTVVSCKNLTDLNKDTKNPEEVPGGTLFTNAMVSLFDYMVSTNVNRNNLRLWAQHWTETTYTDESNYELTERNANGRTFNMLFAAALRDLAEARSYIDEDEFLSEDEKRNQKAIISVMEVMAWHYLVDFFGDVPYTEAFGDDVTPAYDDDKDIYYSIIDQLNSAIDDLGKGGPSSLGQFDLVYGGDVSSWMKMANSLKLRLAIRIADFDDAKAKGMAESAVSSGVFSSHSENFELDYTSSTPNTNPLWEDLVQSGRTDFVAANTLVDYMNALDDPRRDEYFTGPVDSLGNPMGGIFGASNTYTEFSHPGTRLLDPTFPGTLLDYVEVEFLLADAAERGYAVGGTAKDHYDKAITESIIDWGGTIGEATTYLAQSDVDYNTAPGTWREKIGLQKWIAMYNRGFEAWSTWRVYDAPTLNLAAEALTTPPLRYHYPVSEYSLNGENVQAAADKFNNDDPFAPIFWDI